MATIYAYAPNGTQATLPVEILGFTQSLQQNGWCKLPNGLIFQWKLQCDLSALSNSISLVIAASNVNYIIVSGWQGTGGSVQNVAIHTKTKNSFKMQNCNYYNIAGGGIYDWIGIFW